MASPSPAGKPAISPTPSNPPSEKEKEKEKEPANSASGSPSNLTLDAVAPASLHIRNLSVTIDTAPAFTFPKNGNIFEKNAFKAPEKIKNLLNGISATFEPGTLTAIIGGSGSGKTTLLNTLSERMNSPRLKTSGTVLVNGTSGIDNVRHTYVMQQDVLLPSLTVRETLLYSAALRLSPSVSKNQREHIVDQVILELGLKECAHTRIGTSRHRGCSGGEKRRVSIATQMLANPSLLFLDEPTTGLDATSAFQLIRTLKDLAAKGRTIITTIHQPRSEIWELFDGLVLLSRGEPVYVGNRKDCTAWFAGLGHKVPGFVNPAEWVVDLAAIDNRSPGLEEISKTRVDALKTAWKTRSSNLYPPVPASTTSPLTDPEKRLLHAHATPWTQLHILTSRTFKVTHRDPMGMTAALLETTLMGLVTGYIFFSLPRDASGIRSREGALYSGAALQGYLMLLFEVYRMTVDIPTFDRERADGCVSVLPFILSRRAARSVTEDIPVPLVFSVILYFMAGFERTATRFFTFFAISLLNHYIAMTCAMMCVALSREFAGASLAANLIYTVQSLGCGMFIQSETLPVYVRWLKYITYTWYCIGAYAANEFQGSFYDCPYSNDPNDPACRSYTGAGIMDDFGFPQDWLAKPIAVLVAFIFFFIFTTYLLLSFFKVLMTISRARESSGVDTSIGKENLSKNQNVREIQVQLRDFSLSLTKRTVWMQKLPEKTILHPINTIFPAGTLNAIMGPSGSGKTSLLNAMALRLHENITTHYHPSGPPLLNGAIPTPAVLRSLTSYVCQDDDGLLPSLTVRETLHFAAALRLPSFMTSEEKTHRADQVLLKLGLKDCADNLVGSELIKGISGGEKRRVSIAVQILTDPRILLLDEPTSGLDAFTANSLMEVLAGLAAEGRTVIMTIHQARTDLFDKFGNILLLARGGHPIFSGKTKDMLPWFDSHGLKCPEWSNPADFALDAITIDLQEESREVESRARVAELIAAWSRKTASQKLLETPGTLGSPAELGALLRTKRSFFTALPILLHRGILNVQRQPPILIARLTQVLSLAIIMALFFAPLKHDYPAVQNRMGMVQQMAGFYFTGMLQNVALYPGERDVFYREHDDGVYGVEAFLAVYSLLELPFELIASFLSGLFIVFVIGLPHDVTLFFVTVFSVFAVTSCGESVGILFNTLFSSHTGFAVTLTSVLLSLANSMSGILSTSMPAFLNGANYLSPVRYATRLMAVYSLRGVKFTCTDGQKTPEGRCQVATGEDVLELYHLKAHAVMNVVGLAVCVVVYRMIAWAFVRVARTRFGEKRK